MTIHRGACGHIKSHWDNHKRFIKCSCCSRESTCSTCSSWSNSTWILAENRTCASRKWVMSKKKKCVQIMSDSSDEKKKNGNTTRHGPAAWGNPHEGGISKGTCTQRSLSPLAVGHPSTDHPSASHQPFAQ